MDRLSTHIFDTPVAIGREESPRPRGMRVGSQWALDESGNGGMRFLIILYALGITAIGLQPLKKYWAPYVQGATSEVRSYMKWGEPPRRGASEIEAEAPRLVVSPGKSRIQEGPSAPAVPPLDALTSKDKEELDGLLKAISPDSGVSQGRKPEKPKVLSSKKES